MNRYTINTFLVSYELHSIKNKKKQKNAMVKIIIQTRSLELAVYILNYQLRAH